MREMLRQTLVNLSPDCVPDMIDALTVEDLEKLINDALRRA